MSSEKKPALHFRGQAYDFMQLLGLAKLPSTPIVNIKLNQLNDYDLEEKRFLRLEERPKDRQVTYENMNSSTVAAAGNLVIVFKFEGKFTLLIGEEFIGNGTGFKARLISTPTLKLAKIIDPALLVDAVIPAETRAPFKKNYSSDFENRPRFQERKPHDRRS